MKKITLSTIQRIQLITFLNGFNGASYSTLVEVWKLLEKIKFTQEEMTKMEMVSDAKETKWNPAKEQPKEIDFTPEEKKIVIDKFDELSKDNKLNITDYPLAQLYEIIKGKNS